MLNSEIKKENSQTPLFNVCLLHPDDKEFLITDICYYCNGLLYDAYYLTGKLNKKKGCKRCLEKRKLMTKEHIECLQQSDLLICCPYFVAGCKWKGKQSEYMLKHKDECTYKSDHIECQKCKKSMLLEDSYDHLDFECPNNNTNCILCNRGIQSSKFRKHLFDAEHLSLMSIKQNNMKNEYDELVNSFMETHLNIENQSENESSNNEDKMILCDLETFRKTLENEKQNNYTFNTKILIVLGKNKERTILEFKRKKNENLKEKRFTLSGLGEDFIFQIYVNKKDANTTFFFGVCPKDENKKLSSFDLLSSQSNTFCGISSDGWAYLPSKQKSFEIKEESRIVVEYKRKNKILKFSNQVIISNLELEPNLYTFTVASDGIVQLMFFKRD